jgi:2'-5' RNA ligase
MARRIFIAMDIDANLKKAIHSFTRKAFSGHDRIRIIPPENLHITLKFIGDTSEDEVESIKKIIGESVSAHKAFEYIGINEGFSGFSGVYHSLEKELSNIGIEKEHRGFDPHITAARIKNPFDISSIARITAAFDKGRSKADSVTLYESILSRQGARYIIIERFVLK